MQTGVVHFLVLSIGSFDVSALPVAGVRWLNGRLIQDGKSVKSRPYPDVQAESERCAASVEMINACKPPDQVKKKRRLLERRRRRWLMAPEKGQFFSWPTP